MTATYTFDVFASVDGYGSTTGDWGGYWGKQGPEFLERRRTQYDPEQRIVMGADTYRQFARFQREGFFDDLGDDDQWLTRMRSHPTFVVSSTLSDPLEWPHSTVLAGDAVEVVALLKEESDVPIRSHGSIALNRSLMAAGLVDRVQLTVFPVLTGRTGEAPVFEGADDFDLELLESTTLDGSIQELVYRPTRH